ncbi:hypothetical protein [Cellulomonas sp. PhB143]|uniref:hypothetical protein n=1 Tax=Cellulomonas sp. PhB143 TaxID=2485186 RepID=UPI000F498D67|nr:hypothetical protein [Cellulomonas sp. PhB143]ROS78507.1 hypothetical protein EDF32_0404 [Cellulomonas sp. PhB143]
MTTMDDLPGATAARLRRPGWRDPRLLVGVLLVAVSVLLGSWAVSSAGRTVPVYAAATTLTAGDPVAPGSLRVVDVRLGPGEEDRYASPEHLPASAVAVRTVGEGELVPQGALGGDDDVKVSPVAFQVEASLSDRVSAGSAVDVWFVPETKSGAGAGPAAAALSGDLVADDGDEAADGAAADGAAADGSSPRRIVHAAVVDDVDAESGTFVVGGGATVHVLVEEADLPVVLAALSSDGQVAVLPAAEGR